MLHVPGSRTLVPVEWERPSERTRTGWERNCCCEPLDGVVYAFCTKHNTAPSEGGGSGAAVVSSHQQCYCGCCLWCHPHSPWTLVPEKARSPTGFVGLRNLGCTCYMNATLQQLFMIKKLRMVRAWGLTITIGCWSSPVCFVRETGSLC